MIIRKTFSIVLSLALIICFIPLCRVYASDYTSNQEKVLTIACGDGIYAEYYSEWKRLDIKTDGNGIMDDYKGINRPWEDYSDEIKEINVLSDVEHIGSEAFRGMANLNRANFYGDIGDIGEEAFKEWPSNTIVSLYAKSKSDYDKGQSNENYIKLVEALSPNKIGVLLYYEGDEGDTGHGDPSNQEDISDPSNYTLKESMFKGFKSSVTYTGEKITLNIRSKYLKQNEDYLVKYKNNLNVGTAKITIKGKGKYHGSVTKTFKIRPLNVKKIKFSAKGNTLIVKWEKQSTKMAKKRISGYQVRVSTSKNFTAKTTKKITIKGFKKTYVKVTGLKSGKTYYVKMRTYMKTDGKTYYSKWSDVKTKRI